MSPPVIGALMTDDWLALVGLGLEPGGISVAGLQVARAAEHLFLEGYTARSPEPISKLEERVGQPVEPLGRAAVEDGTRLLDAAEDGGCCLLVAGDPLSATTHTSLRLQARERSIPVRVHFAASILTAAAGVLGLSHYKFGRTTTLVTPEGNYFPDSPYDVVAENLDRGLHTLVLLDIREDGTCMSGAEAAEVMLDLEDRRGEEVLGPGREACVVARAGREDARAWRGPLGELTGLDAGEPMHSIVVPGELSVVEEEALEAFVTPVRDT